MKAKVNKKDYDKATYSLLPRLIVGSGDDQAVYTVDKDFTIGGVPIMFRTGHLVQNSNTITVLAYDSSAKSIDAEDAETTAAESSEEEAAT